MRKRNILTTALALAAAAYAARLAAKTLAEWSRYERIREMSDEGPLLQDAPKLAAEVLNGERDFFKELATFFVKSPYELMRYLKAEMM